MQAFTEFEVAYKGTLTVLLRVCWLPLIIG